MYLVVIAWLYVVLMMAVAEANHPSGSVLGALITFVLYGLAPIGLVMYLLSTPARRRALREREAAEREAAILAARNAQDSGQPDHGGETPADPVAPVRKEP